MKLSLIPLILLMAIVSGCSGVPKDTKSAICDGLKVPADEHVDALLKDGGPESQATGVKLIGALDAGCKT